MHLEILNLDIFSYVKHICVKNNDISLDVDILKEIYQIYPSKIEEYKNGKSNLINLFFGEYIKSLKDKNIDKNKLLTLIQTYIDNN